MVLGIITQLRNVLLESLDQSLDKELHIMLYQTKEADFQEAYKAFSGGVGVAAKTIGATVLTGYVLKNIINKIQNNSKRKMLLEDLMMHDMIIKSAPKEKVLQYYATIMNVAPTLSEDKEVVRELLQNFIKFDRIDINTITSLTKAEKEMQDRKSSITSDSAIKVLSALF